MTAAYTATIHHHSISRAREIGPYKTIRAAKQAATREFSGGYNDHEIIIVDRDGYTVARRRLDERTWRD